MESSTSLGYLVTLAGKWSTDIPAAWHVRAGGGCLGEVAGKQNDFLWGKSWVEWANRPAKRETQHFPRPLWKEESVGCSEKGIAVQDSGVSSAAEQTIYQDLGDRCLKEKNICVSVFFQND